jgi:prolyl 4-hydroxylase
VTFVESQNSTPGTDAHVHALRAAEGAGVPQSWESALDLLRLSADQGFAPAQAELAALAGQWDLSRAIESDLPFPGGEWAKLRATIRIADWLRAPAKQIVSASPRIAVVPDLAAPELCEWVMSRARGRLSPAQVFDPETGGPRRESVRNNSQCYLLRDESDLLLCFLRARMASIIGLPVPWMEVPMVLHYAPGEQFLPHVDFLDPGSPALAADVAQRGQRAVTFLLALNDDYEGGQTEFTDMGRRWKGSRGSGLFFWNVEPDGRPNPLTRHAGLPPASGEKWLLSQWVRARPITQ